MPTYYWCMLIKHKGLVCSMPKIIAITNQKAGLENNYNHKFRACLAAKGKGVAD